MDYTVESFEKFILVSTSGTADVEKIEEALKAIFNHEDWRPGFSYIFDHSQLSEGNWSSEKIREIAGIAKFQREKNAVARSAIIAPRDIQFGLSRMWTVYVDDEAKVATKVFRNIEDAITWVSA